MKRKSGIIFAAVLGASMLTACSSELSGEYVTVKKYKDLEVPAVETEEIDDSYVDQILNNFLESSAGQVEVTDRAAEMGDWVNIDYTGYKDGVAFDGGTAQGADLELGSNTFLAATEEYQGFEEQIAGHTTGEEFDITVQFPEEYSEELAGAVAEFHIVLNSIYQKDVPELTDEWASEYTGGEFETVDAYRADIRATLEESSEQDAREQLLSNVQEALLEQTELKSYPEGAVEEQITMMTEYYSWFASVLGVELEEYIEYQGATMDEFNAQLEEAAQKTVQLDEALKLIAEEEGIELTEEEYTERITEYAESAGAEDVDAYIEENGEDVLREAVLRDAVLEYLADNCIQVEE